MNAYPSLPRIALIALIVLVALGLRLYYADASPEAHDEDDYLMAARVFREHINVGEWSAIPNVETVAEHPPLVKLLYAFSLDDTELDAIPTVVERGSRNPLPPNSLQNTRHQSVFAGTVVVLLVALINPLAAAFLAVQSVHVQFSSLAYLDALPTLFVALTGVLYQYALQQRRQAIQEPSPTDNYGDKSTGSAFWLAAVCFGIAVAAKYSFAIVGIALMAHALYYGHYRLKHLIGWGIVAIVVFFLFNPYLWPAPLSRVWEQLTYHQDYAGNQAGTHSLTKPFQQLTTPNVRLPSKLESPLWVVGDITIFWLALPGLWTLGRQKSFFAWWLLIGMAFLSLWPTQWIQHKMMILVPYTICAAAGLRWVAHVALIRLQFTKSSPP